MTNNERQYRILLLSQLFAGMVRAVGGYLMSDGAAKAIAHSIIFTDKNVIRYTITEEITCSMDQADVYARMGVTLWSMIKNTDVTLLREGAYNG